MKKIYTILVAIMLTASVFAQAPEKMSYQAIIRNSSDLLVTNQGIGMQISILHGSATGTAVYIETHNTTTNINGLVTIEIGNGTVVSGDFTSIDWSNDVYFIKTETDPTQAGGTVYTITGTSQLLSVAYALHAKTAESIEGGITETDPVYLSSEANNITAADITNLSNLSGTNTGDQDINGIITNTQAIQDTASQIRADIPDVSGFITTEVDGSISNEIQSLSQVSAINNSVNTQLKDVTNPTDAQDAATKIYVDQMMQIMENNGLTFVDFTADHTTIAVDGVVNFTDNSAINPTTWAWDFGDGNTATIQNPAHAYANAGTYTVSLIASNVTITKTKSKTNYINVDGLGAGLTDNDGNTYTSIIIGGQEWMRENLKVTTYPNGDPIPLEIDNTAWGNLDDDNISDAYSYYNNNASSEADTYGALYTYAAAIGDNWQRDNTNNQGVCPDGWHLPTDAEWDVLDTYLGTNAGSKLAGNAVLWTDGNLDQSADFGTTDFSGLPSGTRNPTDGSFNGLGSGGYWWSATESNSSAAYSYGLYYTFTYIYSNFFDKSYGLYVRCIRD